MLDWPEDLVRDIAARQSVLFLGAGVSKNARNIHGVHPKDWASFLSDLGALIEDAARRAEMDQCIRDGDLLSACELARRNLAASVFRTQMIKEFAGNAYQPAQIMTI